MVLLLRWYQRLTSKIIGIGLIFFALITISLSWQYFSVKDYLVKSGQKEARLIAEGIIHSINTFVLETETGGQFIKNYVNRLNRQLKGEAEVRLVHSKSLDAEYGTDKDEHTKHELEQLSLNDGKRRSYENETHFSYVAPIISAKGCNQCHHMPDSDREVPDGYILGLTVVKVPTNVIKDMVGKLFNESIKSIALISFLLLFVGLFTARHIALPLMKMLGTVQKVTHGNLNERVSSAYIDVGGGEALGHDEISLLAKNFNTMADQMERSFTRLENWNVELSLEVARQTDKIMEIKDHYQSVVDSTQRVIFTTKKDLTIDSVNAEWNPMTEQLGLFPKREDLIGRNLLELAGEALSEKYRTICESVLKGEEQNQDGMFKTEFDCKIDGEKKYFGLTISPLKDSGKKITGLVFVAFDITQRKQAEECLRVEKEKLDSIMDGMGAAVNIVDQNYKIKYMNRIMENSFGESLDRPCYQLIAGQDEPCEGCGNTMIGQSSLEVEAVNGRTYLATRSPITDINNQTSCIVVYKDITYLKQMEEKLHRLTISDNLTGLFNQRHFHKKLEEEMVRANRQQTSLSLLFADIDKFKMYNDKFGHVEGDSCLTILGKIIKSSIRENVDSGFRYGGEEFTIILPGADKALAKTIAERIRTTFASYKFAPLLNGESVDISKTISIGVASFSGESAGAFIEKADHAMYIGKKEGGNRVTLAKATPFNSQPV